MKTVDKSKRPTSKEKTKEQNKQPENSITDPGPGEKNKKRSDYDEPDYVSDENDNWYGEVPAEKTPQYEEEFE